MNELISFQEGFEQAVETTKQHYYALHSDIRHQLLDVMTKCDAINCFLSDLQQPDAPAAPNKPPSRDMKEIYRRVCNLCHPDKVGKTDPMLVKLMQDAKEALRGREEELLNDIYEQVKFYTNNPDAYANFRKQATFMLEQRDNPWFKVYEHHSRGETRDAFFLSRKLLGDILAQRRSELQQLRTVASLSGYNQ